MCEWKGLALVALEVMGNCVPQFLHRLSRGRPRDAGRNPAEKSKAR